MSAEQRIVLDRLLETMRSRLMGLSTTLRDGRPPSDRWAADMYRELHVQFQVIADSMEPIVDERPALHLLREASHMALTKYFHQARCTIAAATGEQMS